jgi:hypothetical protein
MPRLNAANAITEENLTMTQAFRRFMLQVDNNLPILGTGSPEGVVEAPQFSLYIDSLGTTGTIEYRKMQTDIAGNRKQGWVLV